MSDRPPTLADLRVKLCYICREEEKAGDDLVTPRAWVHPCNCTLVAHESCLLEWIKSSEGTGRESSARQCPQCKTVYEVESNNPAVLRVLRAIDKNLSYVDLGFFLAGIYFVVRAIYRAHITYGSWALRKYVGDETFELLLGHDRSQWPLIAKFNIVLIPAGLILSRLGLNYTISALLATWPTFAFLPSYNWEDPQVAPPPILELRPGSALPWPPSPLIFGFVLLPITRKLYNYYFTKFSRWLLDLGPAPPRPRQNRGIRGFLQRFLDDMERAADVRAEAENNDGDAGRGNGGGIANRGENANGEDRVVALDMRKAGSAIGGALLVPLISNLMGNILQRLSKRFDLLKRFLAVRPAWKGFLPPPPLRRYSASEIWRRASAAEPQDAGRTLKFVLRAVWGDIRKLDECDPVWWRNSVGLGIFVVAKDLLQLLHLWLSKRELATRRVKSRDFSAVDPRELDLLPSAPSFRVGTSLPGSF
ncbi:translation initiation factor eIF2 gamma subunit [Favolaschia claudopus]|uniref:Translation initiation factor eIF2 gamma subunit n=1 Tax=Favolaschia claudopus TaxID=2862362 RepID=A0AAW0DUJ0_9AGAR